MRIKSTRHAKYQIAYHFVWIPAYRKAALTGKIKTSLEGLFQKIAHDYGFEILAMEIMPDHVHLFVSAPPKYSPADIVKIFKGISGKKLIREFSELTAGQLRKHIWAPSYYVGTAGQVSEETIRKYIEECQKL